MDSGGSAADPRFDKNPRLNGLSANHQLWWVQLLKSRLKSLYFWHEKTFFVHPKTETSSDLCRNQMFDTKTRVVRGSGTTVHTTYAKLICLGIDLWWYLSCLVPWLCVFGKTRRFWANSGPFPPKNWRKTGKNHLIDNRKFMQNSISLTTMRLADTTTTFLINPKKEVLWFSWNWCA